VRPYAVLYNQDENIQGGDARDAIAARDSREASAAVGAAIAPLGPVVMVETKDGDPLDLSRRLLELEPRVVFNLAEAARGVAELESAIASLLELLGLAYTGNRPQTLALCLDKQKTKNLLHGAGIPVPRGVVLVDAARDSLAGLEYPVIVKPACMDASHGIEPTNVVHDEKAARAKAAELIQKFPPSVIVERFLDGRELNVTIADVGKGPEVLPLAEVDWRLPPGVPRVCGYEAKWVEGTQAFNKTPIVCPTTLAPELERRVREIAIASFEAVSGRDYARVDIRLDQDERPFVLEVNPNPCIAPIAGVARSAGVAGWSYDEFIRRIVHNAEQRGPLAPLARRH